MEIEISCGTHLKKAANILCEYAQIHNCITTTKFNGIILSANPDTPPSDILNQFDFEQDRLYLEYKNSPQYDIDQAKETAHKIDQLFQKTSLLNSIHSVIKDDVKLLEWLCAAEENGTMDWKFIAIELAANGYVRHYGVGCVNDEDREDVFRYLVGQCMDSFCVPQVIHHDSSASTLAVNNERSLKSVPIPIVWDAIVESMSSSLESMSSIWLCTSAISDVNDATRLSISIAIAAANAVSASMAAWIASVFAFSITGNGIVYAT